MKDNELMKKLRASNFIENNGKVLRGINMLRTSFNKLTQICSALGIDRDDFADNINYLSEAGYIRLRNCDTKIPAEFADYSMEELEGKLTALGIKLLAGKVTDDCIRV